MFVFVYITYINILHKYNILTLVRVLIEYLCIAGSSPDHHCKIPEGHSVNESIPMEYQEETEVWKRSMCMENKNFTMATNMTQKCSNGHWYDPEPGNTIVSDVSSLILVLQWSTASGIFH